MLHLRAAMNIVRILLVDVARPMRMDEVEFLICLEFILLEDYG